MKVSDAMLHVYVFVDDFLKANPHLALWRESPNDAPPFSDAEALTLAVMQPWLGHVTLAQTYRLIRGEHADCFPRLVGYKQLVRRLGRLGRLAGALFEQVTSRLPLDRSYWLADSKPIPLCKPIRHGRVRLLREDGASFSKTSCGWYFGFALHILTDAEGRLLNAMLLPAHVNDRHALPDLASAVEGNLVLADHGYSGGDYAEQVFEQTGMLLCCTTDLPKAERRPLSALRQRIETTLAQLWSRFIDRVRPRSFAGLWQSIRMKLLHHNMVLAGIIQPL
jgi:transposase